MQKMHSRPRDYTHDHFTIGAARKKGGRPKAAFKSREETPKEGMCGHSAPHHNKIIVRCRKSKNFRPSAHANVYSGRAGCAKPAKATPPARRLQLPISLIEKAFHGVGHVGNRGLHAEAERFSESVRSVARQAGPGEPACRRSGARLQRASLPARPFWVIRRMPPLLNRRRSLMQLDLKTARQAGEGCDIARSGGG